MYVCVCLYGCMYAYDKLRMNFTQFLVLYLYLIFVEQSIDSHEIWDIHGGENMGCDAVGP
jgi:hypothetical protein